MVAPVIAAGARYAPSLFNLGRRLFSPGPWDKIKMVPKSRGFGKIPKVESKAGKIQPVVEKRMPKGLVYRHPVATASVAAPLAVSAARGIYGALRGDEEEVARTPLPQPRAEWAPPEDLLSLSEQARQDAETGNNNMKKMMKYGFLIAAAGGDPSNFFKQASEATKMSAAYTQNQRYAKQFDAVFREGDMPDSPQMAYKRLIKAGMGPKDAAEITGQVAQLTGKTETERAMNTLSQVYASQGEEAAARLLMTYWATGQLQLPDHLKYAKEEDLFEAARAYVGGAGVGASEPTGEEVEILL